MFNISGTLSGYIAVNGNLDPLTRIVPTYQEAVDIIRARGISERDGVRGKCSILSVFGAMPADHIDVKTGLSKDRLRLVSGDKLTI